MSQRPLRLLSPLLGMGCCVWSNLLAAQVPARDLGRALSELPDGGERYLRQTSAFVMGAAQSSERLPVLWRRGKGDAVPAGALRISDHWYTWQQDLSAPSASTTVHPSVSGIRRTLLSIATPSISASQAHTDYGLDGSGSVVGIVDTGADWAHPALRAPDGATRIRWFLRYGEAPRGIHAELEETYGCTGEDPCAIYAAADIDELLMMNEPSLLPQDRIGHGTHVASIAAGRDEQYPGVAPGADLIVVAAAGEDGAVYDSRILMGCRFVLDRAQELREPAVINISLGSDFGSHRGDSELEQALSELAQGPGRAIVVAAGNSGTRYSGILKDDFGPFGSHAKYAVTPGAQVTLPVLQYGTTSGPISGGIYLWLTVDPEERLEIAFAPEGQGVLSEWVGPGEVGAGQSETWSKTDKYDLTILNATQSSGELELPLGNAVISIVGSFDAQRRFEFALRGAATVSVWATGVGQAAYGGTSLGPLLARAEAAGTVQVPATAPDLIAVGATVNRTQWTDYTGTTIQSGDAPAGLALFSSRGPTPFGQMKPELVAPGDGVIAAMARAADPRGQTRTVSQFDDHGACPTDSECYVIDDEHGLASGTSMAAPMVTGAIALLMQRDPSLTMASAKAYLMAGARRLNDERTGGYGTGVVDVVGALLAQEADLTSEVTPHSPAVSAQTSIVAWANEMIEAAPGPGLSGWVVMRDAEGKPRPTRAEEISLELDGPGTGRVEIVGPGLAEIWLEAQAESAGSELGVLVRVGKVELGRARFIIDIDPVRAEHGYVMAGGACQWRAAPSGRGSLMWVICWLVGTALGVRLIRHKTLTYS